MLNALIEFIDYVSKALTLSNKLATWVSNDAVFAFSVSKSVLIILNEIRN